MPAIKLITRHDGSLAKQLTRALSSVPLNVAEAGGRLRPTVAIAIILCGPVPQHRSRSLRARDRVCARDWVCDRVRDRARDRARDRLTIHHKFRSNLAELRQNACRDGRLAADVTWAMARGMRAWPSMALLAHGATCAGTAATHGHEHGGCRRRSRARQLMNGNLPDALDGARWRFERARCGWPRSRGRTAEQQGCCAARRFLRIIVGGALLYCCYAWGWARGRSP